MAEVKTDHKLLELSEVEIETVSQELLKLFDNVSNSEELETNKANITLNLILCCYNHRYDKETTIKLIQSLTKIIDVETVEEIAGNIYGTEEYIENMADVELKKAGFSYLDVENINRILDTRQAPTKEYNLEYFIEAGDNKSKSIIVDKKQKQTYLRTYTPRKDHTDKHNKLLLKCIPTKITEYIDSLTGDAPTYKIEWASNVKKPFTTGEHGGITAEETEELLKGKKITPHKKEAELGLFGAITIFEQNKLVEYSEQMDRIGFFYDSEKDKILAVGKEIREPTTEELKRAIEVLEELAKYFKGNEQVLATVVKYGLISSLSYCYKQAGNWIQWLLLRGQARAGKTALGKIAIFCSGNIPSSSNNIGATGFNTEARIGSVLSVSTDLITVNEPQGLFKKPNLIEMVKIVIESTKSRGKHTTKTTYRQFPSLAPVILTSNKGIPQDDALLRRLYSISFSVDDKKTPKEIEEFNNTFRIDQPQLSPLQSLKYMNDFIVYEMTNNPSLLLRDWKETINSLIRDLYRDVGLDVPSWLLEFSPSESLDDYEADLTEEVRSFLTTEFNKARQVLRVADEEPQQDKETLTDYNICYEIANKHLIPFIIAKKTKQGTKQIIIKHDITKPLNSYLDVEYNLKSIAELLGWEYGATYVNKKTIKAIVIPANEFLEFVYPTADEVE